MSTVTMAVWTWILCSVLDLSKYASENGGASHLVVLATVEDRRRDGQQQRRVSVHAHPLRVPTTGDATSAAASDRSNHMKRVMAFQLTDWLRSMLASTMSESRPQSVHLPPDLDDEIVAHVKHLCSVSCCRMFMYY